ncbi:serine/threonine-protein phosphatase 6 regulatory ankyrin repeat subunit C-like isoform X3 [Haliotis rufescens]|uniref:serine/threonine-protein phosphatase 6 regulatory ankyrin repeat subunit C-like isoform X3 n=1 Tax=Haliotis rufescens TaxID=6454 RepID=UPI00201F11EB|nr:serine/threonine-protein phosphatase 6 regulatory ankyrin repeat subunit C-like isoform X3 [Haliotis rufescens]
MDESKDNSWLSKQNEALLESQYPLHTAIRDGDMERTVSLLKTGRFDLYEEDGFYGWTPVHWAAHFGKLDILRKLVSMSKDGSPVVQSNRSQVTPAHLAAMSGHPHCLQWVLQAGTEPSIQDYCGETPLHKAARSGSMECVSLLVAQGAAIGLRNHSGHTASQVASIGGYPECAISLEKSLQFQQQSMAANIVQTHTCNNNNTEMLSHHMNDANSEEHLGGDQHPNGDTDMDTHSEESMHKTHMTGYQVTNGVNMDQNGFCGMKRGRDELEEEVFKRRRCDERPSHHVEATSHNNNILSSYNAILAISANPSATSDSHSPEARVIPPCSMDPDEPSHPTNPMPSSGCSSCHVISQNQDIPVKCLALHSHMI